jgi:hypothetical protein
MWIDLTLGLVAQCVSSALAFLVARREIQIAIGVKLIGATKQPETSGCSVTIEMTAGEKPQG